MVWNGLYLIILIAQNCPDADSGIPLSMGNFFQWNASTTFPDRLIKLRHLNRLVNNWKWMTLGWPNININIIYIYIGWQIRRKTSYLSTSRRSHWGRICRHLSTVHRDLCRQDIAICDCNLSQHSCFIQASDSDDTLQIKPTAYFLFGP